MSLNTILLNTMLRLKSLPPETDGGFCVRLPQSRQATV